MNASISQPLLFDFSDTATGAMELFPDIWRAAEALASPHPEERLAAVEKIKALEAARLSPLVAYVLITRLSDPDMVVRYRVAQVIGELFASAESGKVLPEEIRQVLRAYFTMMGRRGIVPLLEVVEKYPAAESEVANILNTRSQAGLVLSDIMTDRRIPLETRRQAINFIGRVGFLDAIPALEKLIERLESRVNGQKTMPFAPPADADDMSLLPAAQAALTLLQEP